MLQKCKTYGAEFNPVITERSSYGLQWRIVESRAATSRTPAITPIAEKTLVGKHRHCHNSPPAIHKKAIGRVPIPIIAARPRLKSPVDIANVAHRVGIVVGVHEDSRDTVVVGQRTRVVHMTLILCVAVAEDDEPGRSTGSNTSGKELFTSNSRRSERGLLVRGLLLSGTGRCCRR